MLRRMTHKRQEYASFHKRRAKSIPKQLKTTIEIAFLLPFKLNKNNAKIVLGDAIKLTLDNSSGKTVIWSSTNENIAKVDQDGNVTGISKGTAVIEVSTEDGQHKASCNVNVLEITDAVVFSFMTMSHISYDGIIAPGATIGWKVSNNGSSPITVKKLILK